MKTNTLMYLVDQIMTIKQNISHLTNEFYKFAKKAQQYNDDCESFLSRNSTYVLADNIKKLRWFLALFVVVPILIIIDYASVVLFIQALIERVPLGIGKTIIQSVSVLIFFVLELATVLGILKIEEQLQKGQNSSGLIILKNVLRLIMIISPALLILCGYLLTPFHTPGESLKIFVFMMISIVIHTIFFLLMDDFLHAINYQKYKINSRLLKLRNPESSLISIKKSLITDFYPKYDFEMAKISSSPMAVEIEPYHQSLNLSKREKFLKQRLEDNIIDNDYEEFVDTKRFTPKPTKPLNKEFYSSSTVW